MPKPNRCEVCGEPMSSWVSMCRACRMSFDRLHSADAQASWDMWNRVFAAHRRLYGDPLDLLTDRREWI